MPEHNCQSCNSATGVQKAKMGWEFDKLSVSFVSQDFRGEAKGIESEQDPEPEKKAITISAKIDLERFCVE